LYSKRAFSYCDIQFILHVDMYHDIRILGDSEYTVDDQSKIDFKFCKLIQIRYQKFVTNQKLALNYIQPLAQWLILYSYIMDVYDGHPLFP